MLLQNQNQCRDLLRIDITSNLRQRGRLDDGANVTPAGMFFEHENELFGLGASDSKLYLILNDQLWLSDDSIETALSKIGDRNNFDVLQNSRNIYTIEYTPITSSGFIPNEDDECLDGFLWIHNILSSPERRALLTGKSTNVG